MGFECESLQISQTTPPKSVPCDTRSVPTHDHYAPSDSLASGTGYPRPLSPPPPGSTSSPEPPSLLVASRAALAPVRGEKEKIFLERNFFFQESDSKCAIFPRSGGRGLVGRLLEPGGGVPLPLLSPPSCPHPPSSTGAPLLPSLPLPPHPPQPFPSPGTGTGQMERTRPEGRLG